MFEHELFRKQIYCIEESSCDITVLGLFRRPPQWFGAQGIVPPVEPSLRLCSSAARDSTCYRFHAGLHHHRNVPYILFQGEEERQLVGEKL